MLVQQILSAKSSQQIITLEPGRLVSQAIELLARLKIGAVVISAHGHDIQGILSERDIVRGLAQEGAAILDLPVEQLMTHVVVSCTPGDTATHVVETMTKGRFRHMPVVQEGRMLGLISIGDVVKGRLDQLTMEKHALEGMIKGY